MEIKVVISAVVTVKAEDKAEAVTKVQQHLFRPNNDVRQVETLVVRAKNAVAE